MSLAAVPRSGWGQELFGIEVLIMAPHGVQSVQQFAHQRDDRLQPGLATGDQPLDKACPWQGTGGAGRRAAPRRGQRGIEQGLAQPLIAPLGEPRPARQAATRGFLADVETGLGNPLAGGHWRQHRQFADYQHRSPLFAARSRLGGEARHAVGARQQPRQLGVALAETQRRRGSLVVGALGGDPRLIAFLREDHRGEQYLLAAVNARLAAPIIIITGEPVIALGGFSGRDPILTADGFARLVESQRVRFALVGDGSPGLRRIFGEAGQKPLVDWIRQNGRLVDPALWRGAVAGDFAAEAVGAQLYDLRPVLTPVVQGSASG